MDFNRIIIEDVDFNFGIIAKVVDDECLVRLTWLGLFIGGIGLRVVFLVFVRQ